MCNILSLGIFKIRIRVGKIFKRNTYCRNFYLFSSDIEGFKDYITLFWETGARDDISDPPFYSCGSPSSPWWSNRPWPSLTGAQHPPPPIYSCGLPSPLWWSNRPWPSLAGAPHPPPSPSPSSASANVMTGFEPCDPERFSLDLAVRINQLMADPVLRDKMGRLGRERVEHYFSWKSIAEKTARLYSQLVR